MLPILNIKHIDKYLKAVDIAYNKVTHCIGNISELKGRTDNSVPFIVKFSGRNTMVVAHGNELKRFDFTEDNYPL